MANFLSFLLPRVKPQFPHTPRKLLPVTVQQQQLDDASRFDPDWHHAYRQRPRIPQTDTGNYAYTTLGLVEFSPIGFGDRIFMQLRSVASSGKPLVFYQAVPVQGLGGLQTGQLFMQPLYDPNAETLGG